MSPTTRVGQSDPTRGTAPEAITPGRYTDKVAVVTGSGSGIGRATARRLAAEGAAVACFDLAEDAIASVAEEINREAAEAGGRAVALPCDVTDEDAVAAAISQVREELGHIAYLCNIAGIGGFAHTPEQSLAGWEKILAVNLTGTFLMCRAVLPGMLEHGGAITNTVSTAGVIGQPYSAAYCASKGGVKMLTKALAVEYMARGVRVNGVAPGGVDTPIIHNFGPPEDADFKLIERLMTPIGFAYPHEIAGRSPTSDRARRPTSPAPSSPSTERSRPEQPGRDQGRRARTAPRRARCDAAARAAHRHRGLLPGRAGRAGHPASTSRCRPTPSAGAGAGSSTPLLPPGVSGRQRPMPARPLHALWRRFDHPALERFVGPADVVHGTNFVVPPTARAAAVVSVHDLTPVHHPELCNPATLAYPDLIRRALASGRVGAHRFRLRGRRGGGRLRGRPRTGPDRRARGARPARRYRGRGGRRAGAPAPRRHRRATAWPSGRPSRARTCPAWCAPSPRWRARHPDAALVLAGPEGWGEDELRRALDASPVRDRIARTGWVEPHELAALLRGAQRAGLPVALRGVRLPAPPGHAGRRPGRGHRGGLAARGPR